MKKKKLFFVVGFVFSAFTASFFIPLKDGSYWWHILRAETEIVVEHDFERYPAVKDDGEPIDVNGGDPTVGQPDQPVDEPEPVYSGNDKTPDYTPAPEPQPVAPPSSPYQCIHYGLRKMGINNMSDKYIAMFYLDGKYDNESGRYSPQKVALGRTIRAMTAVGVCSEEYYGYSSRADRAKIADWASGNRYSPQGYTRIFGVPYQQAIPNDGWNSLSYAKRKQKWFYVHSGRAPANCVQQTPASFKNRVKACRDLYKTCKLGNSSDCADPTGGGGDNDDPHGGNNNGGNNSGGEKEVGEGTNQGSGYGGNGSGDHGSGPPGGVSQ